MLSVRKLIAVLLALCLVACAAWALAAGLERPGDYVGTWGGGDDYGETREYYLEILDYKNEAFTLALDIYRIWSFDGMTALLTQEGPSAVFATGEGDPYAVLGTLDFSDDAIDLLVLESDCPDLPADTRIAFTRMKEE